MTTVKHHGEITAKYLIYGLLDPITKELKYIGKSSYGLKRPYSHFTECALQKSKSKCSKWILEVKEKNLLPEVIILE